MEIGRAAVYYAWSDQAYSAGIKCWYCNFHYGMLPPRKRQPSGNLWSAQCNHTHKPPTSVFNKKIQFDLLSLNLQSRSTSFEVIYALYRAPYTHLNLHNYRPESLDPILSGCVTTLTEPYLYCILNVHTILFFYSFSLR